jgi:hypothetical protein
MLAHVPTWVYGVFAMLLALGLLFTRPRSMHPAVPSLMAAGFGCYSLYGVISSFGASPSNLVAWAIGMGLGTALSRPFVGPNGLSRVAGSTKVLVLGSWVPLVLMMGIFAVKFFVGVVRGAHLPAGSHVWFAPTVCLILGLFSGAFAARGLNVRRFVQATSHETRADAPQVA